MSGTVHRRHTARLWPLAGLFVALVLSGMAAVRVAEQSPTVPQAVLAVAQRAAPAAPHWMPGRQARGKATAILSSTGSGLDAPVRAVALSAWLALLVVIAGAVRPRPRRVGRMHAGRGPPLRAARLGTAIPRITHP